MHRCIDRAVSMTRAAQRMMHRLLDLFGLLLIVTPVNLFGLLLIATPDALRIRELYGTCSIGWLDSLSKFCLQHEWKLFGNGFGTSNAE